MHSLHLGRRCVLSKAEGINGDDDPAENKSAADLIQPAHVQPARPAKFSATASKQHAPPYGPQSEKNRKPFGAEPPNEGNQESPGLEDQKPLVETRWQFGGRTRKSKEQSAPKIDQQREQQTY